MSAIPVMKLGNDDPALFAEMMEAVERIGRSGAFIGGAEVEAFEQDFAAWNETGHALGVSSGTEAIVLALRALDIGPGDEVIVPTNSFIASAEAVSLVGATPRLVDVDPETSLITAEAVEAALTPKVKAVVPVHLYGRTIEMAPLLEVCRANGVAVVEDTCQAHGARYHGQRVGTLGDIGCFSFYPTKNLGAWGDGGACVTNSPELAEKIRRLRSHGEGSQRNRHHVVGTTARLDAIQAAVLKIKLRGLDEANDQRRAAGAAMTAALSGIEGLELPAGTPEGHDHVFHLYIVRSERRDSLREQLGQMGVNTAIHYPTPIHLTEAYSDLGLRAGDLPVAERLAPRIMSLPMFPGISTAEIERVASALRELSVPTGVAG